MKTIDSLISNVKALSENADDEKQQKKTDDKRAQFDAAIEELQKEFNDKTYADVKTVDFEKMTYEEPDDDELMKKAKKSVADKFDAKKVKAETSANDKKKTLSEALANIANDVEKQKIDAEYAYNKAKTETENSALKRGVARSSMAQIALNEVITALADKLVSIDDAAKARADKLNADKDAIDADLKSRLDSIDEERSAAEETAFDKLKKEAEDRRKEALKYNNTLEEKKKEIELKTFDSKTQAEIAQIKKDYDKKKLAVALDYYLSFTDPAAAFKEYVADDKIKDYLGDYYEYLFNILKNRAK